MCNTRCICNMHVMYSVCSECQNAPLSSVYTGSRMCSMHFIYWGVGSLKLHLGSHTCMHVWNNCLFLSKCLAAHARTATNYNYWWSTTNKFIFKKLLHIIYFIQHRVHMPPLRFHCVGGCRDRTQDCYYFAQINYLYIQYTYILLLWHWLDYININIPECVFPPVMSSPSKYDFFLSH
jgi:hypothetical protein